jgi:hypothetical protein
MPASIVYPAGGTFRVSRWPETLWWHTDDEAAPPAEALPRFSDRSRRFQMRYTASTLRGCMIETMEQFRPAPDVETELAAFDDVEDGEADPTREDGLEEWLAVQLVGRCAITIPTPLIVDVDAAETLVALDKHPGIRDALDASRLGTPVKPARLDGAIVRLAGPVGRPITQAIAAAVHEWWPETNALACHSRLDDGEQCWAIYGHTPVDFDTVPLTPSDESHRDAVRAAATLFEIALPDPW